MDGCVMGRTLARWRHGDVLERDMREGARDPAGNLVAVFTRPTHSRSGGRQTEWREQ